MKKVLITIVIVLLLLLVIWLASFSLGGGDSKIIAANSSILSSIAHLRSAAESHYYAAGGSYAGLGRDDDYRGIKKMIEEDGGIITENINKDNYCIDVRLLGDEGYWCIDSDGNNNAGRCGAECL